MNKLRTLTNESTLENTATLTISEMITGSVAW